MFIFKTNAGLIVTCSEAGTYDEATDDRIGTKFLLEESKAKRVHGYILCVESTYSSPEQWTQFFLSQYNWTVFPIKLIEIEWE